MPTLARRTAALVGLACTLLGAGAARATDWNGSYAADGRCYCSGELAPAIARRIVPTPIGGQSVARVCERLGPGPGLTLREGRYDRVVYADAQCGHGPFADGAKALDGDCLGSREPDGDENCQGAGPRWDLATAFGARTARAAEAVATTLAARDAALAVPIVAAAKPARAKGAASDGARIVVIDGKRWRQAPAGTPETGRPGSRVIVDGAVFLAADDPLFDKVDASAGAKPAKKKAVDRARARGPRPQRREDTSAAAPKRPARPATVRQSPEAIRARQQRLLAEARERLRRRREEAAEGGAVETDGGSTPATLPPPSSAAPTTVTAERARATPARENETRTTTARSVAPAVTGATVAASPSGSDSRDAGTTASSVAPTGPGATVAASPSGSDSRDAGTTASDADADADGAGAARIGAEAVAEAGESGPAAADRVRPSPFPGALRLPEEERAAVRGDAYVDAMPVSYDFGGAGVFLEGSAPLLGGFGLLGRLGAVAEYQEVFLGAGYRWTPAAADRLSFVLLAGVETGRFELDATDVETEFSDVGGHVAATTRLQLSRRLALRAGVGYSSFFEGDPVAFGGGSFRLNRRLDLLSRFELGDNDSIGVGVRYHY